MTPKRKRIQQNSPISTGKRPRERAGAHDGTPSWGIRLLDQHGPFGREISREDLAEILGFLAEVEKLTWKEILSRGKSGGHHHVRVQLICPEAQHRLQELGVETDALVSLRLGAKKRIWGVLEGSVLYVLWWDPHHEVYPSKKRHT